MGRTPAEQHESASGAKAGPMAIHSLLGGREKARDDVLNERRSEKYSTDGSAPAAGFTPNSPSGATSAKG